MKQMGQSSQLATALVTTLWITATTGLVQGQAESARTTRTPGGSVKTELGYGIVLNKNSSLQREYVTVHDAIRMKIELLGNTGVATIYKSNSSRYSSGDYQYVADTNVRATEAVAALQVNFILFDVWGNRLKTLSATELVDMEPGQNMEFQWKWRLPSENEASQYFASLAYVAQVRTASGDVLKADTEFVLEQARTFSSEITESDLRADP